MNMRLVLPQSQSAFHLMDYGGKPKCQVHIEEAILEVPKVKVASSEQLHLEKILTALGAKYLLAHVITCHFTLVAGASTAHEDALLSGKIPTKVIIHLVSNEAFIVAWQKKLFNFGHMFVNSACLVVDRHLLQAQQHVPQRLEQ